MGSRTNGLEKMAERKRKRASESGDPSSGPRPIDPSHAVAVLTQLAQMYRDGSRTDLAVPVGERRFEVHGCVLMCGSEFMRTQLQPGRRASAPARCAS